MPAPVQAQDYLFEVTAQEVEAYIEEDGTLSLWYLIEFQNSSSGAPIEFVDIGMPTSSYSLSAIQATLDGNTIKTIESSPYATNGFAINLGNDAIPPDNPGPLQPGFQGFRMC